MNKWVAEEMMVRWMNEIIGWMKFNIWNEN
jgi:hypothetical protein